MVEVNPEHSNSVEYMTPKQVGAKLQVSTRVVLRLCAAGELSARRVGARWR